MIRHGLKKEKKRDKRAHLYTAYMLKDTVFQTP